MISILLSMSAFVPQVPPTQLRAVVPSGEIRATFVTYDRATAYVSEGSRVTILDLTNLSTTMCPVVGATPQPQVVAKVPVEATIMAMVRHDTLEGDKTLFIAGGSFGLLEMNVDPTLPYTVRIIDDDAVPTPTQPGDRKNDRWCFDVEIAEVDTISGKQTYILALFSAQEDQGGSQLRVYGRDGTFMHSMDLGVASWGSTEPGAFAYALSVRRSRNATSGLWEYGDQAYIAFGPGGILKVNLTPVGADNPPLLATKRRYNPSALPGMCSSNTWPAIHLTAKWSQAANGVYLAEKARVRDIDVAEDGSVVAAADTLGVLAVDPTALCVLDCKELTMGTGPSTRYAFGVRIDSVTTPCGSTWVVVLGSKLCAGAEPRAPYLPYGRFSFDFVVGGTGLFDQTPDYDPLQNPQPLLRGNFIFKKVGSNLVWQSTEEVDPGAEAAGNLIVRTDESGCPPLNEEFCSTSSSDEQFWVYRIDDRISECPQTATNPAKSYGRGLQEFVHEPPCFTTRPRSEYTGSGSGWLDFRRSGLDPNVVLAVSEGSSGSVMTPSVLDITNPVNPVYISSTFIPGGVFRMREEIEWQTVGPTGNSEEWFFGSQESKPDPKVGFLVNRLIPQTTPATTQFNQWKLRSPRAPDCFLSRNYHRATTYLDPLTEEIRVVGTVLSQTPGVSDWSSSPWGGVVYSGTTLVNRARGTLDGQALFPILCSQCDVESGTPCRVKVLSGTLEEHNYLMMLETHPELRGIPAGNHPFAENGETAVFNHFVGVEEHAFAVIAAGFFANKAVTAQYSKPMLVTCDLSNPSFQAPACLGTTQCPDCTTPLEGFDCGPSPLPIPYVTVQPPTGTPTIGYGPDLQGNLVSVDLTTVGSRRFAFAGDWGGRVLLFEVTNPQAAPDFCAQWRLPKSLLDGYIDNVHSVQVDRADPQQPVDYLYFTALRIGLVRLQLTINPDPRAPCPIAFPLEGWDSPGVEKFDTPGLAHGFKIFKNTSGHRGILMADKQGGLRIMGEF